MLGAAQSIVIYIVSSPLPSTDTSRLNTITLFLACLAGGILGEQAAKPGEEWGKVN